MMPKREPRCFTIMIIPHSEEATFSLKLPLYIVQAVVVLFIIGVAGFGILGYAYLTAAVEASELQELRQVNRAQQEEIDALAVETQQVMRQILELGRFIGGVKDKVEEVMDQEEVEALTVEASNAGDDQLSYNSYSPYNIHFKTFDSTNHPNYPHVPDQEKPAQISSNSSSVLNRAAENIILLQNIIPEHYDTLDGVEAYIEEIEAKIEQIRAKPSLWPARGRITSGFGSRRIPYSSGGYQFHTGVDIAGSHGSPIWATADGVVSFTGYRGSLGNIIIIDHDNSYETLYAHLSNFAVQSGEVVEKGQLIGYMGRTGRTTGTHLHYEVHYNGSPINPGRFLEGH